MYTRVIINIYCKKNLKKKKKKESFGSKSLSLGVPFSMSFRCNCPIIHFAPPVFRLPPLKPTQPTAFFVFNSLTHAKIVILASSFTQFRTHCQILSLALAPCHYSKFLNGSALISPGGGEVHRVPRALVDILLYWLNARV